MPRPTSPESVTATVSERLADHMVGLRLADVSDAVVRKAKDLLVHHFGVAFRGCASGTALRGVELARELSGANGCRSREFCLGRGEGF